MNGWLVVRVTKNCSLSRAPDLIWPRKVLRSPAPSKSVFDSLEEEMASLLGKPAGKP